MHNVWARAVKTRDNFQCQICGQTYVQLESHHINSYAYYPDQRYIIDNGVTLCERCHTRYHSRVAKDQVNEETFKYFKKIAKIILGLIKQ